MSTTTLSIRTDKDVKERASQIYKELGLNISTATNMFYLATIRENGLPISTTLNESPNEETIEAIEEACRLLNDKNAKGYDNMGNLKASLGA